MAKFNKSVFPGAVFGKLTVVERIPHSGGKAICRCECGKISRPQITQLTNGRVKSCGCSSLADPGIGYGKVFPGARFGRLIVVERIKEDGRYTGQVKCLCDCGKSSLHHIDGLVQGKIKSCGCLNRDSTIARNIATAKFGSFSTEHRLTFQTWMSMKQRCCNPNNKCYPLYGEKGVRVCKFLLEHPKNLGEIVGLREDPQLSIDRFPVYNGHYSCGQCEECKENGWELNIRWATRKEQAVNKGNNVHLTAFGKTLTRSQWQDLTGIDEWRIHRRIHELGWSIEKALSSPDKRGNCYKQEESV